jgi:hydroxymethylpyrimidine/phosphomethylpyrimidine kinase
VVVKAGHLPGEPAGEAGEQASDIVLEAATGHLTELRMPRVATRNDHGTGCSFGAATAALLARGLPVPDALASAKRFVHEGLVMSAGWHLGGGHGPVGKLGAWVG